MLQQVMAALVLVAVLSESTRQPNATVGDAIRYIGIVMGIIFTAIDSPEWPVERRAFVLS
jgi:hypothetical protein